MVGWVRTAPQPRGDTMTSVNPLDSPSLAKRITVAGLLTFFVLYALFVYVKSHS